MIPGNSVDSLTAFFRKPAKMLLPEFKSNALFLPVVCNAGGMKTANRSGFVMLGVNAEVSKNSFHFLASFG